MPSQAESRTSDVRSKAIDTPEQDASLAPTTPSLGNLLVIGGLFCIYIMSLTAVGIYRAAKSVLLYFRSLLQVR
jgi:hypothetical protein